MLITSLPGGSGTPRMRVWRALKARGAGILRDGVYLLPADGDFRALFEEQASRVREAGGSAYIVDFMGDRDGQAGHFQSLFERSDDYAGWAARAAELVAGLPGLGETQCRRQEARLRRDLEAIVATDYFPGAPRERARETLRELQAAVNGRFSPDEPTGRPGDIPVCSRSDFRGRRWATRRRLWVDRVASAWLIRRFIDPDAEFLWLARTADCPPDAVGFDFDGADFSHVGDRVTFEVLAGSFGLQQDPALARLGALVHYLDVGGIPVPEAAGFEAMLSGARDTHAGDDGLLAAAAGLLDNLYAAWSAGPAR